ncbi:hypothetical protein LZ31DRAFT_67942 [Colletotrichum somersetense]|nr:hypothetical protein LZ31DRAFT_67942 [Colletotrichum somersetense]
MVITTSCYPSVDLTHAIAKKACNGDCHQPRASAVQSRYCRWLGQCTARQYAVFGVPFGVLSTTCQVFIACSVRTMCRRPPQNLFALSGMDVSRARLFLICVRCSGKGP